MMSEYMQKYIYDCPNCGQFTKVPRELCEGCKAAARPLLRKAVLKARVAELEAGVSSAPPTESSTKALAELIVLYNQARAQVERLQKRVAELEKTGACAFCFKPLDNEEENVWIGLDDSPGFCNSDHLERWQKIKAECER